MRVLPAIILTSLILLTPLSCLALNVPAGFEDLARGQLAWISVRLNGQTLGVHQAKVDLEHIRFIHPASLSVAVRKRYRDTPALEAVLKKTSAGRWRAMTRRPAAGKPLQRAAFYIPGRWLSFMTKTAPLPRFSLPPVLSQQARHSRFTMTCQRTPGRR
ncbi:hypothetical protein HA45_21865 [Pantoea rodasii]|uniref:hypothetical protein n=1 Tax=Pantoea rodasii TaxID=1076549 RepID=UPI000A223A18|nr:hypothetical protein [Pantoea rodasii]ORM60453.1 hypothetical protein HA45_21865 [Pantoea rodasii]